MILHVEFPDNLVVMELIGQKNIPCLCRVGVGFEVVFQHPLPEVIGLVEGWDRALLEERAVARGGGKYTHYEFGLITLNKIELNAYEIVDLAMFYPGFGWCNVLLNKEYCPPGKFWSDEEDDIGR